MLHPVFVIIFVQQELYHIVNVEIIIFNKIYFNVVNKVHFSVNNSLFSFDFLF